MTPATTSRIPMTAITPIRKPDGKTSSFTVSVTTRNVKIKTRNPIRDRKPPRPILKRCLPVKYDTAFFSYDSIRVGR